MDITLLRTFVKPNEIVALCSAILTHLPNVLFASVGGLIALLFNREHRSDPPARKRASAVTTPSCQPLVTLARWLHRHGKGLGKLLGSIVLGLCIGETLVFYYGWQSVPSMATGLLFVLSAVFGLLVLSLIYHSIEISFADKPLPELIKQLKAVLLALFNR